MRAPGVLVAFVLAAAAALSPRALAEKPRLAPADAPLALNLRAEHLDLDVEKHAATMTGNVTVTRGALELRCPRLDVRYDDGPGQANGNVRMVWIKGTGGVVASVKGVRAEAPEVEIDVAAQTMALKGGVRVTQGAGWITAERASVNLTTGKVSMTDVKGSLPVGSASTPEPSR